MQARACSLRRHYPDQVRRVEDGSPPLSPMHLGLPVWMCVQRVYEKSGLMSTRLQSANKCLADGAEGAFPA